MDEIAERRAEILERMARAASRAGRRPDEIRMVAVSKTVGPERVRAAWEVGQRLFAENRAQELSSKMAALSDLEIEWHFVGHLQTNKVRQVMPGAALIHSVDRTDLAAKIARRASPEKPQPVLVQVNTSAEDSKSGVEPGSLVSLLDSIAEMPALRVDGLMTIGPWTDDEKLIREAFHVLRTSQETERRRGRTNAPLDQLSMGMTGDFEIAIEEGATIVRIGTALFGSREATR